MKKFKEFLNEAIEQGKNDYSVGDIVKIRYWMTGDITSVKIINKITKNNFIVSHKVADSELYHAPDQEIKKSQIIGIVQSVSAPVDSTARYTANPNIRPDTAGLIPGTGSFPSNDISI